MTRKAIIFYCKDCGGWLFICLKDKQIIKDSGGRIIQYLSEGHKMEEVDMDKYEMIPSNCECKKKGQSSNLKKENE